ncbi:MAG TPA: hypothetical protein VF487_15845 [Chitinophagaceae bacterium]
MKKFFAIAIITSISIATSAQSYKGTRNTQTPEQKLNEEYCTGLFKATDGIILDVASQASASGYLNILDWINGRVAGLQIYTNRWGVRFPVIRGSVAGVYIDEIPVPASTVNSLNVNDIAIIKVIKTPFYGGFNGAGGAIAIYTLKGEEEEE